jgi:hypothetical protein
LILNRLLATLANHAPVHILKARSAAEQVQRLNHQIHDTLLELVALLKARSTYADEAEITTPFDGYTNHWMLDAIKYEQDAIRQHGFESEIRPVLAPLADQFFCDDCWPSPEAVFTMLADRQLTRPPKYLTYTMEAASQSKKGEFSPAVLRALWECQFRLIGKNWPTDTDDSPLMRIPLFRLNDPSMATLANLMVEDGSGCGATVGAVKRLRGEERKKAESLLSKPFDSETWNEWDIAQAEDRFAFWSHQPHR